MKINRTTTGNLVNAPFGGLKRFEHLHVPGIGPRGARVLHPDQDHLSRLLPPVRRLSKDFTMKKAIKPRTGGSPPHGGSGGGEEGRGDRRAGVHLHRRRGRLSAAARTHGRRPHHRPADRLEQGVYGGRPERSTHLFNTAPNGPALPGNEAFGIRWSFDGKFAVFVGGYPVVVNGEVVGGVGLSGGNGEQDTACGVAALEALRDLLAAEDLDRAGAGRHQEVSRSAVMSHGSHPLYRIEIAETQQSFTAQPGESVLDAAPAHRRQPGPRMHVRRLRHLPRARGGRIAVMRKNFRWD